jgi:hypothetical protein
MFPGPNDITKAYTALWRDHIPEDQIHTFYVGGYYAKPVVPGLVVLSLNTLVRVCVCVLRKRATSAHLHAPPREPAGWR